MSETSTTQIHLLNLTARPVQLRVSLHPGIRDYFRDGGSHKRFSARIRAVLNAYFFAHAGVDDIRKYLGPYEHLPEKLEHCYCSNRDVRLWYCPATACFRAFADRTGLAGFPLP